MHIFMKYCNIDTNFLGIYHTAYLVIDKIFVIHIHIELYLPNMRSTKNGNHDYMKQVPDV